MNSEKMVIGFRVPSFIVSLKYLPLENTAIKFKEAKKLGKNCVKYIHLELHSIWQHTKLFDEDKNLQTPYIAKAHTPQVSLIIHIVLLHNTFNKMFQYTKRVNSTVLTDSNITIQECRLLVIRHGTDEYT